MAKAKHYCRACCYCKRIGLMEYSCIKKGILIEDKDKQVVCSRFDSTYDLIQSMKTLDYYNKFRNAHDVPSLPAIDPEATTKALEFSIRYMRAMKRFMN